MSGANSLVASRWKKLQREPTNREKNGSQALSRYDHGAIEEMRKLVVIDCDRWPKPVEDNPKDTQIQTALTSHKSAPTRVPSVNVESPICISYSYLPESDKFETHEN